MRSIMARTPFERCGVRCCSRPSVRKAPKASTARICSGARSEKSATAPAAALAPLGRLAEARSEARAVHLVRIGSLTDLVCPHLESNQRIGTEGVGDGHVSRI